jgi:PucR C-terminal helix-turn-helix domain/GGDEF-like domain
MTTAKRVDLLQALDRQVNEVADHISAAALSTIPAFADLGESLRDVTVLIVRSFVRHAEGARKELDSSLIDRACYFARCGFDSGSAAHFWRIVSRELWVWLTTKSPFEFDLRGAGLVVWNEFLATHDRYAGAFMDAFFETQTELRARELSCRRATLASVLAGMSSDQTECLLRELGIRSDHVLVARCSFGAAPNDPSDPSVRFQPLLREMQTHSRRLPWTVSDGRLVLCLPHDVQTKERLVRVLDRLEPTVRIGISRPWSVTESLADADRQADLALRGTSPTNRLVDFGALSLMQIAALQVDLRAQDIPQALHALLAEDARSDHEWLRTAEALVRSQGSISGAAAALRVHTNTIYYRVTTAHDFSGLDLRSPRVLADIQFIQASRSFGRYMS